jgi:DNA mismatch repair protein MutS
VFLHAVKAGAADRSYGLHVAALAGVPKGVIELARERLVDLENNAAQSAGALLTSQLPLFQAAADHPLVDALKDIDPDNMTPQQSLQALYTLKELARQALHS